MESMNDALIACVKALGGSKQVGPLLWPDAAPDAAQRKLLDCLNEDRHHHLTPGQMLMVLRLARQRGFHEGVEFITASGQLAAMLCRMESLQAQGARPNLRAAA